MNRRQMLIGGAAAAVAGGIALREELSTIVVGHTKDAISRITHEDEIITGQTVLQGRFDETATGRDLAHWANGKVGTVKAGNNHYIQLFDDFNSGPLPDGWVAIHPGSNLQDEDDVFTDDLVYIAPLKAGKGAQVYDLPAPLMEGMSIVIVCRQFREYIGSATLS